MSNTPKINLSNSLTKYAQSIRKKTTDKDQNYAIKDCIISIAASKTK